MNVPVTMTDLYAALDLRRDATRAEIRAAYRKLSKKYHPDMPKGSAAKFNEVKLAHDILTNPVTKERYDKTGDATLETPEGNADAVMYNFITQLMNHALAQIADETTQDVLAMMKTLMDDQRRQEKQKHKTLVAQQKKLTGTQERLSRKKKQSDDILKRMIAAQIQIGSQQLAQSENNLAVIDRAEQFMSDYKYRTDDRASMAAYSSSMFKPAW